jgi:hypothetical protein
MQRLSIQIRKRLKSLTLSHFEGMLVVVARYIQLNHTQEALVIKMESAFPLISCKFVLILFNS